MTNSAVTTPSRGAGRHLQSDGGSPGFKTVSNTDVTVNAEPRARGTPNDDGAAREIVEVTAVAQSHRRLQAGVSREPYAINNLP